MTQKTLGDSLDQLDIEVRTRDDLHELYEMALFLEVSGLPDKCVGISFGDNEVNLFHTMQGAPQMLFVSSPTEDGAAAEYLPMEAVEAMLVDLGIATDEQGRFCLDKLDKAVTKTLADYAEELNADLEAGHPFTVATYRDLNDAVIDAYNGLAWE